MPTDNPNVPLNPTRVKLEMGGDRLREMQTPSKGRGEYALAIAKVVRVDNEAKEVTLLIMVGEDDYFQRIPIPLTFPAAGPRHFMGAMPERGSYCVVGYLPSQPSKIPIVISWVVPGVSLGHDWVPTQEFQPEEFDFNMRRQTELEGIYERARHKLRHMNPGNIIVSSSQGSDIVLDESVLITNRRASEILLRDQDQAIVTRSMQRFDVQGGVRTYSGMVQRDATLLASQMVSDGIEWASYSQRVGNIPIPPEGLTRDTRNDEGYLTPNDVFYRNPNNGIPESGISFGEDIDPYDFLIRARLVDRDGYLSNDPDLLTGGAVYGGKRFFRPFFDPTSDPQLRRLNSVTADDGITSETLTEHRIEVTHTWDQLLPVSEQTEGLDVDRIPSSATGETNDLLQGDRPFVEVVYGSVVGNDSTSDPGRDVYGVPLRPVVFDPETNDAAPSLESGLGFPVNSHAATLLRVEPPLISDASPTWFSIMKDGRVRGSVGGAAIGNSLELTALGGVKIDAGGQIVLSGVGGVAFKNKGGSAVGNVGYEFDADTSGIHIRAGGAITTGNLGAQTRPQDGGPVDEPHLLLEAPGPNGNAVVSAKRNTQIAAGNAIQMIRSASVEMTPRNLIRMITEKQEIQVKVVDKTVLGKSTELYSGPKNFSPTNAPLRSVTFAGTPLTGHIGGATDTYKMVFGDREELFLKGNHETSILVGNMTYQTAVGRITHRAGVNQVQLSTTTGLNATIPVGVMSMTATGAATYRGVASVRVTSAGPATMSGSICILGGDGKGKVGGIVSQSDIDPLSGLPLGALGLGSPGHLLAPPLP